MYRLLIPLFATLLSIFLLKEQLSWYYGIALVMIMGGLYLMQKYRLNDVSNNFLYKQESS
ncbi:MAG TPA: hypothetical protein ENN77_01785 [Candidatus Wirthbacteria bacterium]|nr:hypothetical protein [Candidatus Wirthbacteria bacterium]